MNTTRTLTISLALAVGLGVGLVARSAHAQVPPPPPVKKPPAEEPAEQPQKPSKAPPKRNEIPKEVLDRVKQAKKDAKAMGKYGDWLSAADTLEQAYIIYPEPELRFLIGQAAREAKQCERAMRYFQSYLEVADMGTPAMEQDARTGLNELMAFECPPRTADDEAALAETLARRAKVLAGDEDWLGAALGYARAYALATKRPLLAYEAGVASWNAHECGTAVSYFYHFRDVAGSGNRSQVRQANKYIADSEAGKCKPWKPEAKAAHARELYAQGQNLEFKYDYLGAAAKYERAYELLPDNVGLSYSVAEAYWTAQRCAEAEPAFREFVRAATDPRYAEDLEVSKTILARIDTHGCPTALWDESIDPSKVGGGGAAAPVTDTSNEAASPEGPPPIAGDNGSTVACSVGDVRERGGLGLLAVLGMFGLGFVRRRRR